jgi:hypothetical protein
MKRLLLIGIVAMMLVAGIAVAAYEHEDTTDHCSASVSSLGWNGEHWLISGWHALVTYDGESFTEIEGPWGSEDFDFEDSEMSFSVENNAMSWEEFSRYSYNSPGWVVGWFGGHWLLTGGEWVMMFDGEAFVARNQYCLNPKMTCGDTYCLMIGDQKPGSGAIPILWSYDGTEFVRLAFQMEDAGVGGQVSAVSRGGGDMWYLITKRDYVNEEGSSISTFQLVRYDGTTFEKVADLPDGFFERSMGMGYNGEYLLLTDGQRLFKYEDGGFTDLTDGIDVTWNPSNWCNDIIWADGYWMIVMDGHLLTYDGETFTELMSGVADIAWNGEYWLLIDSDSGLLRYDGETFTDLTCAFQDAGTSPGPGWHYLVPVLAVLTLAAIIYVRGRR